MRRRDGSVSSLRELTTLQRWIVEGTLSREDEIGLDGETWRVLGTIPDLGLFFSAADARAQVVVLEGELARLKAKPPPSARVPEVAGAAPGVEAPPAPRRATGLEAPAAVPPPVLRETPPPVRPTPPQRHSPEPAFTRTAAGLGVAPADDWEPPRLHRGMGAWVVVVLVLLVLGGAGGWAYLHVWLPEKQRAREEQERNGQLEREQQAHEAQVRAAEQRAKEELLQSLAAAQAQDGGVSASLDAGLVPHGVLEAPPPAAPAPSLPSEARVAGPASGVAQIRPPSSGAAGQPPPEAPASDTPSAPTPATQAPSPSFDDWMAEANHRRTHERASSALAAYDRALALKPLRSDAHAGRGLALLDLGRRPEALAEFQRALELDPRDGVAVLGLAETYRSLGRSEEARRAYQRYLDGWPEGAEAHAARAALESLKE